MARENMGTNIDQGVIARVVAGVKYAITGVGPENFFGPSQPLAPQAQDASEGRGFDYPVGVNLRIQPRNTEDNPFYLMRQLADGYDLLRTVIETRKDQIKSFEWEIVPIDEKVSADSLKTQIADVTKFLERPDREHAWDDWLSMIVEDLLVIDAIAIYPSFNRGGKVMAFDVVDAATITRKIDVTGRTPLPPSPAYQQILHGIPANDLTTDQLVYMIRNPRSNRLYGYSPVEQIIMTVNIALRRQMSQLEFYTSGNVPEAIAQVPETWTPKNVADFQLMWDALNEGNTAARRKMRFVPNLKDIVFPKKEMLKDEYDEWLARIVCFAFSIPPTAFIKQNNRATGEQAADTAKEEGLMPLMRWLSNKMNFLISEHLKVEGVKFKWKMENVLDPLVEAQCNQIYVQTQVKTPDEVREELGLDAMSPDDKEKAWPTPPAPIINQVPNNQSSDKKQFEDKAKPVGKEDVQKMVQDEMTRNPVHVEVHPPTINLGDTFVRVAGAEPSPVNVHIDPQHITLNPAEPAEVSVQLGDVTVQADMRGTINKSSTRTVTASRQPDGTMLAKFEDTEEAK